uniref:Polyhydroxyalkanoate synthase n=1 Tax=uncultured bacterium 20 TaxID=1748270 RepID=A0A0U3TTL1_9BACT|nr:polyhydroxyalkanoate synthase [uncultured bacterium 20]
MTATRRSKARPDEPRAKKRVRKVAAAVGAPKPEAGEARGFAERVVDAIPGPNPFVGFSVFDVLSSAEQLVAGALQQPGLVLRNQAAFAGDLARILSGRSTLEPEEGDRRFQDPTWKENPFYRAGLQTYLAWRKGVHRLVEGAGLDAKGTERARFVASLMTEALAPTNFFLGNPAAIKRALETGGGSLLRGLANLFDDVATNGGMPSQVDKSAFRVGENLASTPGAVVFRNEVLEVIQYAPAGAQVYGRPLLLVPPQINKYYVIDLSPGKSLVEYAVASGIQFFAVSWRNPTVAERDWGLETYLLALSEAIDAVCEITGSERVNTLAACAGGITLMLLLSYLAAEGDRRVNSVTLLVTLLDTEAEGVLGLFASEEAVALAKLNSWTKGVLPGEELGRVFAWLRPNDLVWNYWVNNYLLGNAPPAFDVLYWNNDTTRLPARLHGEFLDLFLLNPFRNPDALELLGKPIDVANVSCDAYVVAGTTDHITPWKTCYATTQLLTGEREFVLSSSGHIQSIVNPPGNPKARFLTNPSFPADPDDWAAGATPHTGSWWEHWTDWLATRSGERKAAPKSLGSERHQPLAAAPGTYVHG